MPDSPMTMAKSNWYSQMYSESKKKKKETIKSKASQTHLHGRRWNTRSGQKKHQPVNTTPAPGAPQQSSPHLQGGVGPEPWAAMAEPEGCEPRGCYAEPHPRTGVSHFQAPVPEVRCLSFPMAYVKKNTNNKERILIIKRTNKRESHTQVKITLTRNYCLGSWVPRSGKNPQ